MLSKPFITFAIPSFNSANYLHIALDSLSSFDDRIEVLIIDDGNSDDTLRVAEEYAAKYPNFKAIHQDNKGHGGAINTAISLAKGHYFKVLDSDDWVNQDALLSLLEDIEKTENLPDIYVLDYTYWQGYEKESTRIKFTNCMKQEQTLAFAQVKPLLVKQNLTLHSSMFRTSIMKDNNIVLPEHCFYEDNYFVYAALNHCQSIRYIHKSLYQYLIGREGQSMSRDNLYKRWAQILRVSELVFNEQDITTIKKKDPGVYRILKHHLYLVVGMTPFCCQVYGSKESVAEMKAFFKRCKEKYPTQYKLVKYHPILAFLRIPGPIGCGLVRFFGNLARLVVCFN